MRKILILLCGVLSAQITLEEFNTGTFVPQNLNLPFVEENLLFNPNADVPETFTPSNIETVTSPEVAFEPSLFQKFQLRTNDFQPLQQLLATERQFVRIGSFYVNQGPEGPGLVRPLIQENTSDSIETTNVQFIFGATEADGLNRFSEITSASGQSMILSYFLQGAAFPSDQTIVDTIVIGSAFHDYQYSNLTPLISISGATIDRIEIDGRDFFGRLTLPPTDKLRIVVQGQSWLIYLQEPVIFIVDGAAGTLTANRAFTGFLRVAALQTSSVPSQDGTTPLLPGAFWSTAALAQSFPWTPLSMFVLWPDQWTPRVGNTIALNLLRNNFVPECEILSSLLPLLALSNPSAAQFFLSRITEYDIGNNAFLTTFFVLLAPKIRGAITAYQSLVRPPPSYGILPSAALTEEAFDAHRNSIPTAAEVTFEENRAVWTYTSNADPLVIFPAYKTLETLTPVPGFAYLDPIKGDLLGVVGSRVAFSEGPLPFSSFIPPGITFSRQELGRMIILFQQLTNKQITETDLLGAGKQTYELALTAKLGVEVMRRFGYSLDFAFSFANPLMERVKEELRSWLITRDRVDFFVGDTTVGGLTTLQGLGVQSADNTTPNALYSDHHTEYGYWIGAAAFVVEFDELFALQNPFIAQPAGSFIVKDFVDTLWRDTRNFDLTDPCFPFNRYGNPWEGHSTSNGFLYTPLANGRTQESWAEDFNSWVATATYARAIQNCSALPTSAKEGSDKLETFANTNTQMTATSGKLIYQDNAWIFTDPYAINVTVGTTSDASTEAQTVRDPGEISCSVGLPSSLR